MQQAVIEAGARDPDMVGELEAPLESAPRDTAGTNSARLGRASMGEWFGNRKSALRRRAIGA